MSPGEAGPTGALAAGRGNAPLTPAATGWLVALLGWTVLMCFHGLDGGPRFEPIDCWVAQTAREMQDAGDWLLPRFSGEIRMQKSPGPYWAVLLTSLARGTPVDEVSARIPNALAAVLLVMTVFWLARRIAGDRGGLFAGFATSASVLTLWWSHRAASDLGLAAFTTLSLAAVWIGAECEPPGRRRVALWLLGYFAAGLGMLYKMPMPLAVVGLPVFCYVLLRNRWSLLASRWHLVGLVLFLLPWLPWVIAVTQVEDAALAKWKVEFIDRFTGQLPNVEGQDDWTFLFTYLVPPLLFCLPFTLSLPGALGRAFRRQPGVSRNGTLFMVIWFASLLVFFTASTGKEWRYFLPALPPLCVLLGIELARFFDPQRRATPRLDRVGAVAVWVLTPVVLALGGGVGLRMWFERRGRFELAGLAGWSDVWQAYAVAAVILAVGFGLAAWLYVRRREHVSFGVMVVTMWAMWGWSWSQVMPLMMSQRAFSDFAERLRDEVPREYRAHLCQVGSQDPRITWYSDVRFPRVIDQLELLTEQKARVARHEQKQLRDLDYEMHRYGEEMIKLLEGDTPALFVAALPYYVKFLEAAPPELAKQGRPMPPTHLWLQTRYGDLGRHFVVFGNQPPPFAEPELWIPEGTPEQARARIRAALGHSATGSPATRAASQPDQGG